MPSRPAVLILSALVLAAVAPRATAAEPNPLCGAELSLEHLEGDYILSIAGGVLPAEGRIVPVGVTDTFGVSMRAEDDHLVMRIGPDRIVFETAGETGTARQFAAGIATADMARPDFEAAVGCEIEDLPRLVARDTKAPAELVYELIVHAPVAMVGTISPANDAGPARVIHLDRQS